MLHVHSLVVTSAFDDLLRAEFDVLSTVQEAPRGNRG